MNADRATTVGAPLEVRRCRVFDPDGTPATWAIAYALVIPLPDGRLGLVSHVVWSRS